jgi:hypothetical protein
MKKRSFEMSLVLIALVGLSACTSDGGSPASAAQQAAAGSGIEIAYSVDANLQRYLPSTELDPSQSGFYVLKNVCAQAGGFFDNESSECFCPDGGLFSTEGVNPSCTRLNSNQGKLVQALDGASQNSLTFNGVDVNSQAVIQSWVAAGGESKPFRTSFVGASEIQIGSFDMFGIDQDGTFSTNVRMFQSAPYLEGQSAEPFYEPDVRFVAEALGADDKSLTDEDRNAFSGFLIPELPDSVISQVPGDIFSKAYESMRSKQAFTPNVIVSPYPTGCASYCIASMPVDTGNPQYSAIYVKTFQLGTPSTRTIVVRDDQSSNVVGIIALNAAETVSTLTFTHLVEDDQISSPFFQLSAFDRYGRVVALDISNQLDIFSKILQGMKQ